jgi:DNA-binding NtrC family response regulator
MLAHVPRAGARSAVDYAARMGDEATRALGSRLPLGPVGRLSIAVARGKDAGLHAKPPAGARASVGTAADADVILTDATVSRYHVELAPTDGGILVRDLGSTNGTFAGNVRVREALVPRGAMLRLGDTTLVVDAATAEGATDAALETTEPTLPGVVYASAAMREVARRVGQIAPHATAVLVEGETGAGKELVARAVHALSPRRAGPFVTVDAAALPPTLLEAELFGHERGAFTGADRARAGAFERAAGGTVFLDELGELSLGAQAALLGVLERKRLRRVGGDRELAVDVRVVSATNRDLRAEVNRGAFRADLYYRVAGARVVVPPLRDRPEDVPVLARHFAAELGAGGALGEDVVAALASARWPGNVRELRSAVERAVAFGPGDLAALFDDAPQAAASGGAIERYRDAKARAVAEFEERYVRALMSATGGNASEAARRAQMDRPYLLELLRKHGLR